MNITWYDLNNDFLYVDITMSEGFEQGDVAVELAIVAAGTAVVEADWTSVDWADDRDNAVRVEAGPGSTFGALDVGRYNVYTRIAASVVNPVRKAGTLTIKSTA